MRERNETHPANIYNLLRHHVFSIYEKTKDIDIALGVIPSQKLLPEHDRKFHAALKAELIVYETQRSKLKLEPLLDAGVKADFSGIRKGKPINIDVTTNLDYKDIDAYTDVIQKRGKLYEIAYVDLKSNDIEFYPLRFPLCPECRKFSHYVLFLEAPEYPNLWASEEQDIVRYCPHCDTYEKINEAYYIVDSPLYSLKEKQENLAESDKASFNSNKFLSRQAIPIITFFEKSYGKLLSGVTEEQHVITIHDGEGHWTPRLLWNHPLVRDLDRELDYLI